MRHRGDDDAHVAKRLKKSDDEEEIGHGLADLVVVNRDLDDAVAEIKVLIDETRRTRGAVDQPA